MPLLGTSSASSSRGYGFTRRSGGRIVFSTPGTYTWIAPTSLVKSLTGTGGTGSASSTIGFYRNNTTYSTFWYRKTATIGYTSSMPSSGSVSPSAGNYAVESYFTNLEVSFNNGATWGGSSGFYPTAGIYSGASGSYIGSSLDYSTVRSAAASIASTWDSRISTTGASVSGLPGYSYYYYSGDQGGNSSALGYTFSGATGSATPTTSTYNNITVTPGTSYTIVVGNNLGSAASQIIITW